MFINALDPVLLHLGPFQIRYYGLMYVIAILFGYWILHKYAKEKEMSNEVIEEYILWLIIGIILGARMFHVIVYHPVYYFSDPVRILFIWKGGLSSHGGILGGIFATWLFCRRKKIPFYTLADMAIVPAAFGAILVRIGNFINGEIVGRITDVPWAVQFQGYEGFRHPSQLYEAAKNLIVFGIVLRLKSIAALPPGMVFWSFVFFHSLFRFFVEFFKDFQTEAEPLLGVFTVGQMISVPLAIMAGWFLWKLWKGRTGQKHEQKKEG
ncbi:prolipoprotein diacylglyceryl transferase [Candidatus Woesearchaeota archaeon]|nr:prolipoprotein diacylglyceryl transferase [Candidatus Woesearchaeota archaeon]